MIQQAAIVKYLADRRETIAFWIAAALGLVVAVEANLAPYYAASRIADAYKNIGFPLVFHCAGGIEGRNEFSHLALSADIAIAVVFSLAVGAVARRLVGRIGRRSRFAWCAGPPLRRAPWQFSLRQMLLIVVLVAAACAVDKYVAAEMNQWP